MSDETELGKELAELERIDPAVGEAALKYDEAVAKILSRTELKTCEGCHEKFRKALLQGCLVNNQEALLCRGCVLKLRQFLENKFSPLLPTRKDRGKSARHCSFGNIGSHTTITTRGVWNRDDE